MAEKKLIAKNTLVLYFRMMITMLIMGLCMGMQPAISYNFGSKNYRRMYEVLKKLGIFTVVLGVCLALAVFFGLCGSTIFRIIPNGALYTAYIWAIPAMIGVSIINQCGSFYLTAETAANRFKWLWWFVPLHVVYVATLFVLTGHGYLQGVLPASICEAIASVNACRLDFLLGLMGGFATVKLLFVAVQLWACKKARGV